MIQNWIPEWVNDASVMTAFAKNSTLSGIVLPLSSADAQDNDPSLCGMLHCPSRDTSGCMIESLFRV
jgi:hypothetical protein